MSGPVPPDFLTRVYQLPFDSSHPTSIFTGDDDDANSIPTRNSSDPTRPYVTLTFAQSLDAKIAGTGGKQLALSGKESLVMTHWMRTMHDAILVGIGTALNDDPQLNTRHLPPLPPGFPHKYHCPRPIILDAHMRLPSDCKLLKNYRNGNGRRPWVICSSTTRLLENERIRRKSALQNAGARVIEVAVEGDMISIPHLLARLRELSIRSLMVEGGARIIQSFLAASGDPISETSRGAGAVDTIIVTVAPTLVGSDGVGYGSNLLADALPALRHVGTEVFGRDAVVALQVG